MDIQALISDSIKEVLSFKLGKSISDVDAEGHLDHVNVVADNTGRLLTVFYKGAPLNLLVQLNVEGLIDTITYHGDQAPVTDEEVQLYPIK